MSCEMEAYTGEGKLKGRKKGISKTNLSDTPYPSFVAHAEEFLWNKGVL